MSKRLRALLRLRIEGYQYNYLILDGRKNCALGSGQKKVSSIAQMVPKL